MNPFTFVPINYANLKARLLSLRNGRFSNKIEVLKHDAIITPQDLEGRREAVAELESVLLNAGYEGKLSIYGSSANGTGFKDCDLDLYFHAPGLSADRCHKNFNREILFDDLLRIADTLSDELQMNIGDPVMAMIPVLKLDFKSSMKLRNGLQVDISLSSRHAVAQTKLIEYFGQEEPLFRDLVIAVKYWMKQAGFTDKNKLNSISTILMVMFFMQRQGFLPAVRDLQGQYKSNPDRPVITFNKKAWHRDPEMANWSLATLFLDLVLFYEDFFANKSHNFMISPHYGKMVARPQSDRDLFVQDVFDLVRNQANSMDHEARDCKKHGQPFKTENGFVSYFEELKDHFGRCREVIDYCRGFAYMSDDIIAGQLYSRLIYGGPGSIDPDDVSYDVDFYLRKFGANN